MTQRKLSNVQRFCRLDQPRPTALIRGFLFVLTVFVLIINGAVSGFLTAAPWYQELLVTNAQGWIETASERITVLPDWLSPETFDPSSLIDFAGGVVGGLVGGTVLGVASFISLMFLTLVVMVFMLAETLDLSGKLREAFGERAKLLRHVREMSPAAAVCLAAA